MNLDLFFLKHYRYFYLLLKGPLPSDAVSSDCLRATAIQYGLTGLATLHGLSLLTEQEKKNISNFFRALYIPGRSSDSLGKSDVKIPSGFRSSTVCGNAFSLTQVCSLNHKYLVSSIFYTFFRMCHQFHLLILHR